MMAGLAAGLPAAALAQEQRAANGGRVASFEMAWVAHTPGVVGGRARAVAEVMTGRRLARPAIVGTLAASGAPGGRRRQITLPDAPELEIVYLVEHDELRMVDTELAASTAPEREMAQDEAIQLAKRAFDGLARHNVVVQRQYDWSKPDVASTWVGSGSLDGKTSERKRTEYRITVRRTINGIELANAGVRIAVHASGRVSSVRVGGVSVASRVAGDVEEPTGKGRWLNRRVPISDLDARFARSVPEQAKARVAWSRVMYVMPETRRAAVVEPLYVVSYSLEFPTDAGETAVSRRKTVGLSLVDPAVPPLDLTPPAHRPVVEKARKRAPER
jgi:hypothetical protein